MIQAPHEADHVPPGLSEINVVDDADSQIEGGTVKTGVSQVIIPSSIKSKLHLSPASPSIYKKYVSKSKFF